MAVVVRAGMIFPCLAVALMMPLACGPKNQCASCGDGAVHVLAASEVGKVIDVLASDVACTNATVVCVAGDAGACSEYRIVPIMKGNCHIDVDLMSGTRFSADVKIVQETTCCPGLFADPPSSSQIEVP